MAKILLPVLVLIFGTHLAFSQADSLMKSGSAKQKAGKHDQAILDFSEVVKQNESAVRDYLKKWDDFQLVSDSLRNSKEIQSPAIDIALAHPYYLRGISYVAMKKNDEAMNDFNTVIKINPKSGDAYCERGKLLWTAGKKYEGCSDLRMARNLGDSLAKEAFDEKFCWNEAVMYYKEAISKLKLNQFETVFSLIQKSIQLSPDSAVYYVVRGRAYLGMDKLELALPDFDRALKALPNNKDAYFGRGMIFFLTKKYQEAFDDFGQVIKISGSFSDAYLYRAYTCEGMGNTESALFDYQQVQRLKPNDPLAFYKSGLLRKGNGDAKGACADFKKAVSLGYEDAEAYTKGCK